MKSMTTSASSLLSSCGARVLENYSHVLLCLLVPQPKKPCESVQTLRLVQRSSTDYASGQPPMAELVYYTVVQPFVIETESKPIGEPDSSGLSLHTPGWPEPD